MIFIYIERSNCIEREKMWPPLFSCNNCEELRLKVVTSCCTSRNCFHQEEDKEIWEDKEMQGDKEIQEDKIEFSI